jgi:hypothetical protein
MLKFLCLGIVLVCMQGCLSPGTSAVVETVRAGIIGPDSRQFDIELMKRSNAGVLRASINGRDSVFLGLAFVDPEYRLTFTSVDEAVIQTFNGRIVATRGLSSDLSAFKALEADPIDIGLHQITPSRTFYSSVSLIDGPTALVGHSNFWPRGSSLVSTGYGDFVLNEVAEVFTIPSIGYRTENIFWVDDAGVIVQSVQQLHPELPNIEMLLFSYQGPRS